MLSKFIFSISEAVSFMLINQMAVLLCKAGILPFTPPPSAVQIAANSACSHRPQLGEQVMLQCCGFKLRVGVSYNLSQQLRSQPAPAKSESFCVSFASAGRQVVV